MDSYLGDLADIVRATTTTTTTSNSGFNNTISSPSIAVTTSTTIDNDHRRRRHHQPPAAADWTSFHANSTSSMEFSSPRAINQQPSSILSHDGDFGDPFSNTRDPLLGIGTELDAIGPTTTTLHHSTGFFSHHEHNTCASAAAAASDVNMNIAAAGGGGGLSGGSCRTTEVDGKQQEMAAADEDMKITTTCSDSNHTNIFSRILQISPSSNKLIPIPNSYAPAATAITAAANSPSANRRSCTTTTASASTALPPAATTTAAAAVGFMSINSDMINNNNNNNPIGNCTTPAAGATAALQISSPRNPGIKRRKSQAKKVVCIPAPAATNTRQGGEVVPSDLWAWRKYGQKPIKGSPYPRGYYRCSSSKGCSARKQVERSKTDPNMLVITYTSEHNHPWPTQRNALAGSTRTGQSSSSKNTSTAGAGNAPASTKPSEINACATVKQGNNRDGIGEDTVNNNDNNNNNNNNRIDLDTERMDVMMIGSNSSLLNGTGDQYLVKEEVMLSCVNKGGDDDDGRQMKGGGENEGHREGLLHRHQLGDQLLVDGSDNLYSSYRPIMPDDQCNYLLKQQLEDPQDSFFADLGELEADPLTLLFRGGGGDDDRRDVNNAAAVAAALLDNDPFSGMFDWVTVHNNDGSSSSSSSRKQL